MGGHVIAADRAKFQPPLEPLDVMLLANFVTSNAAYRYLADGYWIERSEVLSGVLLC
jgi:hypothetical protein